MAIRLTIDHASKWVVVVADGDRFQTTLTAPVLKPSVASVLPLQFELRGDLAT